MTDRKPRDHAFRDTVREALEAQAETLFRQFIGEPVRAGSHDWRPKRRSSFSMNMQGFKRGLWTDFVTDESGDLFDFVAVYLCGLTKAKDDFSAVLRAAANWSGVSHDQPVDLAALKSRKLARAESDRRNEVAATTRKSDLLNKIIGMSKAVVDTPAAIYLASRGIVDFPTIGLSYLPAVPDLAGPGMAMPGHPSLVVWATNDVGLRTGGQRILIGPDGSPARLRDDQPRKPAFATTQGNPARFWAKVADGPLCVAEGPESALSVWQATGYETWAVFGTSGWSAAPLPLGRRIIFCPDQDTQIGTYPVGSDDARRFEAAARTFADAVAVHVAAGRNIWIARTPEPAGSKNDLNDTLQKAGNGAVAEAIATATSARPAPFYSAPVENRAAAIAAHPATVKTFFREALSLIRAGQAAKADPLDEMQLDPSKIKVEADTWARPQEHDDLAEAPGQVIDVRNPPRVMLTGAQGVGKTRALIAALQDAVGVVSLILQPDHGMAGQFVRDCSSVFGESGPVVVHLRGRTAQDPSAADKVKMCLIPAAAEDMATAGCNVRSVLCRRCPMAALCGHMKQEAMIERLAQEEAGVVIVAPHEYAFLPLPGAVKPDLVVMDEAPRSLGFESAVISYDALSKPLSFGRARWAKSKVGRAAEQADAEDANHAIIQPFREDLRDAFRDHATAPLQALRNRGYTAKRVQDVLDAVQMFSDSGMSAKVAAMIETHEQSQRQGTKGFDLERDLSNIIADHDEQALQAFLQITKSVLVELSTGRPSANSLLPVADANASTAKGSARPGIRALFLKTFHHGNDTSFLHLDGTGDHYLMERLFGPMRHACHRVERQTNTTQIVGRTFSVQSITGQRADGKAWGQAGDKRHREAAQLRSEIIAYCQRTPDALVVGPLKVITALQADGLLNSVAHHGALRGRNNWENLTSVIMISREQPTIAVEDIARAYAARDAALFQSLDGARWVRAARVLRTRSGPPVSVEVDCHPDPWAERVLRQMRDASLCQGIDRVRSIYRGPVDVTIMSSVALDITIDRTEAWVETKRGGPRVEQAIQRHKVIPLSDREAHRLMPDIFPSRQTAQRELNPLAERIAALLAQSPNNNALFGDRAIKSVTLCAYQLPPETSKRIHRHEALVLGPPSEARATLEALTGALRLFEMSPKWEATLAALALAEDHARQLAKGETGASIAADSAATPPTTDATINIVEQRKSLVAAGGENP